ncbi:hypothetical protein DV737_g4181, partial [Chaetothyriales sp. CBS 132003]
MTSREQDSQPESVRNGSSTIERFAIETPDFHYSLTALPASTDSHKPVTVPPASPYRHDSERMKDENTTSYPGLVAVTILMAGVSLAALLVALDRTIVATAIPRITDEFDSPGDVGWYGSAYLLTSCAFQPTFGRVFANFDVKWSFLLALGLFELGSLICGAAPTSSALIIGRAIAGLGCAGKFAGCLIIITLSVPLARRPMYMGLVGSIFGIDSVCGPIIGGAFTSSSGGWRWCFYFNLPVGALTFISLIFFFKPPKRDTHPGTFLERVFDLDLIGNLLLVTAVMMLLLALQFGGSTYPWRSAEVIGLLVGAGAEMIIFLAWQNYRGANTLIPFQVIGERTVAAGFGAGFLSATVLIHVYYLPYWFQVVRGTSPTQSGVDTIPYFVSNFAFSMAAGFIVTKVGFFNPPALLGPVLASIGSGLITTFELDMHAAKWAGYEVLAAAGIGTVIQQGVVAVQAVLPPKLIPIGTALIMFSQSLSRAIFVSVGNTLLQNQLLGGLEEARLPGVDIGKVLESGVTNVRHLVPDNQLMPLLRIYNDSLRKVFIMAIPLAAMGLICAIPMEWRSLKGKLNAGDNP